MRRALPAGLLILGLALSLGGLPTAAPAQTPPAEPAPPAQRVQAAQVMQPRAFGHVLGDVLTQRVRLGQGAEALAPKALPEAGRVGLWLDRRATAVERDAQGVQWLRIDYQVINAPPSLGMIRLPALSLPTTTGPTLAVPAWPVSLGPLSPAEGSELPALQPDRLVALRDTAAPRQALQAALAALAAVLLAWLGWWVLRQWREAQTLPFARASARLRRADGSRLDDWQALHEAINHSAGRVVHAASLARLVKERPAWKPLHAELEAFFAASNARFFGAAPARPDPSLRALALALRQVEKQTAV